MGPIGRSAADLDRTDLRTDTAERVAHQAGFISSAACRSARPRRRASAATRYTPGVPFSHTHAVSTSESWPSSWRHAWSVTRSSLAAMCGPSGVVSHEASCRV